MRIPPSEIVACLASITTGYFAASAPLPNYCNKMNTHKANGGRKQIFYLFTDWPYCLKSSAAAYTCTFKQCNVLEQFYNVKLH